MQSTHSTQPTHSPQPKYPAQSFQRAEPIQPLRNAEQPAPQASHSSQTIARLVGPVLVMIGVGMLANGPTYRVMAGQFLAILPLIYFSGILMLVAGLAILNAHPQWTSDWRSVVTAVGWILTCVGAFRIMAPQFANFIATAVVANGGFFTGAGVVLLALGGFISFKGYVV
jgi:uncharacterized membrane protein